MVKWQSSVTPKFLTESDKRTDALPTVVESGKKNRNLDFLLGDKSLVVSVMQNLTSSIHFCIEKRSGI